MTKSLFLLIFSFIALSTNSQTRLEGKVVDENGNPIPFASVGIENSAIGTICNANGFFELSFGKQSRQPVIVSHLGYERQVIDQLAGYVTVVLKEAIVQLEEVKVTTLTAKGMMELAIDRIDENYEFDPVTYTIYTSTKRFNNNKPAYLLESIVNMHRDNRKVQYDMVKLRGKPASKEFNSEFREARTIWIMGHKWQLIENRDKWSLNKSSLKLYSYSFDSITIFNDRLVQVITATPTEKGLKKDKDEFIYFIDLDNYAIVKCHENGSWEYDIEYQLVNGKWHLKSFYKHARGLYKKPYESFIDQTVVLNISEGKADDFESLGYQVVEKAQYRIEDWNDSFWEDYNFIKLEDYWTSSE